MSNVSLTNCLHTYPEISIVYVVPAMDAPLTIDQLKALNVSKGECFGLLEGSFDYALPQGWLNEFADRCAANPSKARGVDYQVILSTTVWHMDHGPVTCCREVAYAARRLMKD